MILAWKESYTIGNPTIDSQHKALFSIINDFDNCFDREAIKSTILELYRYTREHFASEEALMKKVNYPGLNEHRALHDQLIEELNVIVEKKLDTVSNLTRMQEFLYKWLVDHILTRDMDLAHILEEKQIETE